MKLVSFSIRNYRSISKAYKLPLADYAVIVGPNNEGKSNILKGLGLALSILTDEKFYRFGGSLSRHTLRHFRARITNRPEDYLRYNWERDFPINLQKNGTDGLSEFVCEFELRKNEFEEFRKKTKINLSTNLKARVSIGKENVKVDFIMKGKGKVSLNERKREIIEFINRKLFLQYIPSIRTSDIAIDIVNSLLERELSVLENNPEFKKTIKKIESLQSPIIKNISKNLKKTISEFIPDVKKVLIKKYEDIGSMINASCRVYIDDGVETDLKLKGDGIISLIGISLLKYFSGKESNKEGFILLIEEPENHLHPKAIHNLKDVLYDISKINQIIITTHSPILIERSNIDHNIIVRNNKATPGSGINEIRESLGIAVSDNLSSAYLIILVEGATDAMILNTLLKESSNKLKSALESGTMIIDHLAGSGSLKYKASIHKNNLCNILVYLDDDQAGRRAIEDTIDNNIIKPNEYFLSKCKGRKFSELEDLIDLSSYRHDIISEYGVDLDVSEFKNNNYIWSDRIKKIFEKNGKIWNKDIESKVKETVARLVEKNGLRAINKYRRHSIESLVNNAENIVKQKKTD